MLGDSPIILWKVKEEKPDILFQEHDVNHLKVQQNVLLSNVFVILVRDEVDSADFYLVTQDAVKSKLFEAAAESLRQHTLSRPKISEKSLDNHLDTIDERPSMDESSDLESPTTPVKELTGSESLEDLHGLGELIPADELAVEMTQQFFEYDAIRVGLPALNVFGTIGDSMFDPEV
jgi:hypothetical protein